jgi:ribonuclease P protein component
VALTFELKKTQRILERSEFLLLTQQGRKFQDNYFIVLFLPGKFSWPRLGVTASKRVGNAVNRNWIKRRVRECFRLRQSPITGNWDINIIAKKSAAGLTFNQVCRSLEKLFARIGGF